MSEIASPTSNTTETGNNDRENNHETEAVNRDITDSNNFVNEDDDLGITAETAAAIDSIVSRIDVVEELQDDVDLGLDVIGDGDISDHQDQDVLEHEQVLEAPTVHEDQPSETVEVGKIIAIFLSAHYRFFSNFGGSLPVIFYMLSQITILVMMALKMTLKENLSRLKPYNY